MATRGEVLTRWLHAARRTAQPVPGVHADGLCAGRFLRPTSVHTAWVRQWHPYHRHPHIRQSRISMNAPLLRTFLLTPAAEAARAARSLTLPHSRAQRETGSLMGRRMLTPRPGAACAARFRKRRVWAASTRTGQRRRRGSPPPTSPSCSPPRYRPSYACHLAVRL